MKVSWDDYSQYMENKIHVPNHQPEFDCLHPTYVAIKSHDISADHHVIFPLHRYYVVSYHTLYYAILDCITIYYIIFDCITLYQIIYCILHYTSVIIVLF